eukprot:7619493-Lingulodinium_polyedra.AAC.1
MLASQRRRANACRQLRFFNAGSVQGRKESYLTQSTSPRAFNVCRTGSDKNGLAEGDAANHD